MEMDVETPPPSKKTRKRVNLKQEKYNEEFGIDETENRELIMKTVKCKLCKVLTGRQKENVAAAIEKRVRSISQIAVKASHLCGKVVEELLDDSFSSSEWPNLSANNFFVQLFTKNCEMRTKQKPCGVMDRVWETLQGVELFQEGAFLGRLQHHQLRCKNFSGCLYEQFTVKFFLSSKTVNRVLPET